MIVILTKRVALSEPMFNPMEISDREYRKSCIICDSE